MREDSRQGPVLEVIIDSRFPWAELTDGESKCWYAGSRKAAAMVVSFLEEHPLCDSKALEGLLDSLAGNFAIVVERGSRIIAAVDKIRSYPLFYVRKEGCFAVSNSARFLKDTFALSEVDDLSLLEFEMAGYVTGRETLYRHLYQLQAGEFLAREQEADELTPTRYYVYYKPGCPARKEDDLLQELEEISTGIFRRLIEEAAGRPVWVALSGGLDSRFILCSLKHLGCDNLRAFSYGLPGNYEAKIAREVAERCNVPWILVPTRRASFREFFWSEDRTRYWAYADGLCSLPNLQDHVTLKELLEDGRLQQDAVLVNGQSGDFITGGHVPARLIAEDATWEDLWNALQGRHYSLWLHLRTPGHLERFRGKALSLLRLVHADPEISGDYASLYEYWEWQERQCKYVVNGQRNYDFFSLHWSLPLWDSGLLSFWATVPPHLKYRQQLYVDHLKKVDLYGLFRSYSPVVWRWPGWGIASVPLARVIGMVGGKQRKEKFYKYASYFGHYGNYFAAYGLRKFIPRAGYARRAVSFLVETWVEENMGITLFPSQERAAPMVPFLPERAKASPREMKECE